MTALLVFWLILLLVAIALATLRDIHDDGSGRRQPPPSHYPDMFDPSQRFRTS